MAEQNMPQRAKNHTHEVHESITGTVVVSSAQEWCSDRVLLLLYEAKRKKASILEIRHT
jgi:hypothetical protein